ncbi:Coagulation factor IX, partial [Frankliniella fusca]
MAERLVFGSRVVRGPDWKWGEQDGRGEGTVISNGVFVDGWVLVRWDKTSRQADYRMGKGFFDLKLVRAEPQDPEKPVECVRFKCSSGDCTRKEEVCDGHKDCRDGSDEENCKEPLKMSGEQTMQRLEYGSRVVRGPDWEWGDQDGDPPGEGTVVSNGVLNDGQVVVRWDNGRHENQYRMRRGTYDLRLVSLEPKKDVSLECARFRCGTGDCLREPQICNDAKDCRDGSDETNCDTPFKLSKEQARFLIKFGSRVVRGPDWQWGYQDGIPPGEGVVVSKGVLGDGQVQVQWENNPDGENGYRMTRDVQDLRLLTLTPKNVSSLTCRYFKCDANECIRTSDVCDKYNDCSDKSDELNCDDPGKWSSQQAAALLKFGSPVVRGPDWKWAKQDGDPPGEGVVISKGVLADGWVIVRWKNGDQNNYRMRKGTYDLKAVSGPKQDLKELKCDEFKCGSGECVRKSDVCDGHNDCGDASDEEKCEKTCGSGEFKCKNRYTVSWEKKCDGTINCADGSDEDPELCDGPSTTLDVGETVTATMNFASKFDTLRFSVCNSRSCDTVMMRGFDADGKLAADSWPRCNRWGVNCQKGFWLTTDVKRPIAGFTAGELSFQVQRKPVSVVIWKQDNPADNVSMAIDHQGSNRLRISALNCEGDHLMPVTFTAVDDCGQGNFKCPDGSVLDYGKKCDGTRDCGDGADEDEKLCDESATTLSEGETVTATINFRKKFESLRFSLCNKTNCESMMVRGLDSYGNFISDGYRNCNQWGVHCDKGFQLTSGKLERTVDLVPGELEFVVQRLERHMVVWLKANPNQNLTMEVPRGRYRLRISALRCEGNLLMPVKYSAQLMSPTMCGVGSHKVSTRIIGGSDTSASEFPWHVGLYVDDQYNCGGSLLSERIVITAAHCVFDRKLYDAKRLHVVVGNTYREWSKGDPELVQRRNVKRVFPHLHYRGEAKRYEDDIAILEVATPFTMGTTTVVPICVDLQGYIVPKLTDKDVGKVPGWGLTTNQSPSSILQSVNMPYIPYERCAKEVPTDFLQYLSQDKFCAGYINGSTTAQGDSGGGLVFQHDGRWYLQGIVSVGNRHVLTYNAFTKVSNFIGWINSVSSTIRANAVYGVVEKAQTSRSAASRVPSMTALSLFGDLNWVERTHVQARRPNAALA